MNRSTFHASYSTCNTFVFPYEDLKCREGPSHPDENTLTPTFAHLRRKENQAAIQHTNRKTGLSITAQRSDSQEA